MSFHAALIGILTTRRYIVTVSLMTVLATVLLALPLIGDFGFEFSFATGCLAFYLVGIFSALHFSALRGTIKQTSVGSELCIVVLASQILFIPSLALAIGKGLWTVLCDFSESMVFFLLLPVIASLLATTLGALCGLIGRNARRSCLLFLGYSAVVLAVGGYRMLTEAPVFSYNDIVGYFPGPIYDEVVRVTPALLTARGMILLKVAAIVCFLLLAVETHTWRIRLRNLLAFHSWPADAALQVTRLCLAISIVAIATCYVFAAELGVIVGREYIRTALGGVRHTEHFDIFYDINSDTARRIELIARDHEFQYTQLTSLLNVEPDFRVSSFIYSTPQQKKRLMGARYTSIERPGSDEMHLNDSGFPHPVMKHELAHVLSSEFGNRLYGGSYMMGFHEGLASAADWPVDRLTLHQWSRAMRELNLAPPLESILGTVGFWSEAPSRSYTLCGSFVRFLIDQYGIESFKNYFPDGDVESELNRTLSELIGEWETFVDSVPLADQDLDTARQRFRRPGIFERTCPHETAALMDQAVAHFRGRRYEQAWQTYRSILTLEPENPNALRGLMLAASRADRLDEAESAAVKILSDSTRSVTVLAAANLNRGDRAWSRGEPDIAKIYYREALSRHANKASDREALVKLDALGRPKVVDRTMTYLLSDRDQGGHAVLISDAIADEPDYSVGYYLAGRRLYNAEAYVEALPFLVAADSLGLPGAQLSGETRRLIALSYFLASDYERAEESFVYMGESSSSQGIRALTDAWIVRCRWFRENQGIDPIS